MTDEAADRPASQYDSSHISKDIRADLPKLEPEIARQIRDVADRDKSPQLKGRSR